MTSRIPETHPPGWSAWSPMGNTMPPRDPNDNDEEEEDEGGEEKKNEPDEPAVVREPDDE